MYANFQPTLIGVVARSALSTCVHDQLQRTHPPNQSKKVLLGLILHAGLHVGVCWASENYAHRAPIARRRAQLLKQLMSRKMCLQVHVCAYNGHFQLQIHFWPLDGIVNCLIRLVRSRLGGGESPPLIFCIHVRLGHVYQGAIDLAKYIIRYGISQNKGKFLNFNASYQ